MNKTLSNSENYNKFLTSSVSEIFSKYSSLSIEYSKYFIEHTFILKSQYFKYIYLKGLETISNIFKLLLLYTKNLELTFYHSQKSYYYYIEFIGQIGDSNHQFLQLNSKDALLFVYKKTVFEIDTEHRKIFSTPKETEYDKFEILTEIIRHYNILIFYSVDNNTIEEKKERDKFIIDNCNTITAACNKMAFNKCNLLKNIQFINTFIEFITTRDASYTKLIDVVEILHKKFVKNDIDTENLNIKIFNNQIDYLFESLTPLQFCNWLITNV
jgi:hypothetical protein|tara:strand:- start:2633 stop:3442 length:810 start_codon:yes stop_codon:yes gene_type:complete